MNANDVYKILIDFIKNDFDHLKRKVDWIFALLIGALVTLLINLIARIV